MHAVLDAVVPIFALIGMGYAGARRGLFEAGMTDALNRFVVWLALPALLFAATAHMRWPDIAHADFIIAFGGGMAATFLLSFLLDRRRDHRLCDRAIEGLDAAYGNTGFLGLPLGLALFGQSLLPALVIAALLTACVLFGVAIILIELDSGRGPDPWRSLTRTGGALLGNPMVIAPLAGGLWAMSGLPLPVPLDRFLGLLGAAAGPCALVAIGLFLAEQDQGGRMEGVWRLVVLKLLVQPALTLALALCFAMPKAWFATALLMSALPIGTGPFMLARLYGRDAATTSRAILISTLLSLVTVSGLVLWQQG
jgi:predicted permease